MTKTLHTLFHHLSPGNYPDVYEALMLAPKFVFGGDVVKFLQENNAWRSMRALVEAGLARLPQPEMTIEYAANNELRWFIHLKESADGPPFLVKALFYDIVGKRIFFETRNGEVHMDDMSFNAYDFSQTPGAHAAIVAVTMALFLTNLHGIEKQQVVPKKSFNDAQARKGRPRVPEYTYVKIGTAYDRDGRPVKGIGGGSVRMHLRNAYNRRQHYGPGNSLTKIVHIEACIVNYNPDEQMQETTKKVMV